MSYIPYILIRIDQVKFENRKSCPLLSIHTIYNKLICLTGSPFAEGLIFAVILQLFFCVVHFCRFAQVRKVLNHFSCFPGSGKRRRVTDEGVLRLPLEFGWAIMHAVHIKRNTLMVSPWSICLYCSTSCIVCVYASGVTVKCQLTEGWHLTFSKKVVRGHLYFVEQPKTHDHPRQILSYLQVCHIQKTLNCVLESFQR